MGFRLKDIVNQKVKIKEQKREKKVGKNSGKLEKKRNKLKESQGDLGPISKDFLLHTFPNICGRRLLQISKLNTAI